MKSRGERSVEALTWAAVVMWLGFALIMHLLEYAWLVLMVLGIILLSSAIYQRSRGWHTSLFIWIGGVWMAIFSVIEVTNEIVSALSTDGQGLEIDLWVYLGIALISMGLAVVLRHIQPPSLAQTGGERMSARDSQDRAAAIIPRRVAEDYSSGYFPPDNAIHSLTSNTAPPSTSRARAIAEQSGAVTSRARPADPSGAGGWTQRAPQPRSSRSSRRARPAAPAEAPSDLESRVEDIIRRSRQRRGQDINDDNLPY